MILTGLIAWLAYRTEMDVTVEASGKMEPRHRHFVKAKASGRIVNILVSRWDRVEPGQVIAQLDVTEIASEMRKLDRDISSNAARQARVREEIDEARISLESERRRAMASKTTAQLRLDQVEREYRLHYGFTLLKHRKVPIEALLPPVRIRLAAFEEARASVAGVESRLETAALRLGEIERLKVKARRLEQDRFLLLHRLNMASIRSAECGTVITRRPEELIGKTVESGHTVVEVAAVNKWQARVDVKGLDIGRVKRGQKARVCVEAFPHPKVRTLAGKVLERPVRTDDGHKTYPVTIAVERKRLSYGVINDRLAYGMGVSAKIVVERSSVIDLFWRKLCGKMRDGIRNRAERTNYVSRNGRTSG